MSGEKSKDAIRGLYSDLSKYQSGGSDYEKALKVTNKLLNYDPSDFTAFQCKIVCMIQLGKFQDALRQIYDNENKFDLTKRLAFERAYLLYRMERVTEALEILEKSSESNSLREKELKAQILYRMERYKECYTIYREIVKNTSSDEDDFESERMINMAAVSVNLSPNDVVERDNSDNYEACYNRGCALLALKRWTEAEEVLKKAEKMCVKFLEQEEEGEVDEDDIEKETGIIKVQRGYALQMQGRGREAQAVYNQVLRSKPNDIALVAVASNNLIVLNKDQNIFDSKKRIKACYVDGLDHKLTSVHRKTIAINNVLLAMYTNQVDSVKTLAKEFSTQFGENTDIIVAGVLSRVGKRDEAVELLLQNPTLERVLITTQLLLTQPKRNVKASIKLMEDKIPEEIKYRSGILSAMVTLYSNSEDNDGKIKAANLLKRAAEYKKKHDKKGTDVDAVWRKTAEFHLRCGEPEVAAQCLEELLKTEGENRSILSQLVLAYAKFDLAKALKASKKLPKFANQSVDVDALESGAFKKVTNKIGIANSPQKDDLEVKVKTKTKKKKNKKKKLPKNYDPNVEPDPERWIPRRERAAYRKPKRDRRKAGEKFTGAQGGSATAGDSFDYSSKKASTASGATPKSPAAAPPSSAIGPRLQQRKHQQQKKKKKKGF